MVFASSKHLTFQTGDLFLGRDGRREIGIKTDRHAITIAGARSGKGACAIIPNLLRWPYNTLVIDPKGENAEKTWKERLDMGQSVYVLDPFEVAEIPNQLRAAFNPLAGIDPESLTAGSDLKVIADGLVKRSDPKHAQWDDGAVKILAGIMAFIVDDAPPENRTLTAMRDVLRQGRDDLYADAQRMIEIDGCDGLAKNAGLAIMTSIDTEKSMEADYLNAARTHTDWIDMKAIHNTLHKSTFDLSELKTGAASVYLVLPPQYLDTHAAFLRLFVRCAINAMAAGGSGKGKECLFILDEFFSLGKIDTIEKTAGSMPSYGVHLWPFLQDLGQLITTYGREGAETFFANADLHQFFGNADPLTLDHISTRFGAKTVDEVALPNAPSAPISSGASMGRGISALGGFSKNTSTRMSAGVLGGILAAGEGAVSGTRNASYQNQMQDYQHEMQRAMSEVGTMRLPPDKVAKLVQKSGGPTVDRMINFVAGIGPVLSQAAPYFVNVPEESKQKAYQKHKLFKISDLAALAFIVFITLDFLMKTIGREPSEPLPWFTSVMIMALAPLPDGLLGFIPQLGWWINKVIFGAIGWMFYRGWQRKKNHIYLPATLAVMAVLVVFGMPFLSSSSREFFLKFVTFGLF